ncbi:hypothetical protein FOL46_005798 [Perkinsus olseni]|uniref:N-acetyltransferase domain-containing protein n=1 Tax=Perkinsus olseni TaxID=32597 RepID=A0A7J6MRF4_PEROL|nr:hypothetical protein FOL46_005798 [Perkinsus olseni]
MRFSNQSLVWLLFVSRPVAEVVYRAYHAGDNFKLLEHDWSPLCAAPHSCFVGVNSGTKNVVAVVVMTVPADFIVKEVEDAIKAKMPEPSKKMKDGIIGHIDYIEVAPSLRGKGIGGALLSVTFKQLREGYPKLVAVYLAVLAVNLPATALYEKSGFVKVLDRVITISWMGEVVQTDCVGDLGHYVLIGSDRPSSDPDEPGGIPICGMDANLRLALFNHENGADVYIMLLRPSGNTDDPDSAVGSVFLDSDPTSVPVRLGPTIDDDEWLTLEYGEAVRWDPESVLHLGDSHTATVSLGNYSSLTPQALLRRSQFLSSSAATEGDTDSNDSRSATAFNTEINRRVSAASSDCQSSLGNSSPKSRKGRKRRPSSRKGVSFYDDSDPPEENCPPLKQPRRASVVQFDAEAPDITSHDFILRSLVEDPQLR